MKIFLPIVFFIINLIGYSQEHSSLFECKRIIENSVYKVVEYDPTDSMTYFSIYPNGYYSIYDEYGRMVESNHYAPYLLDSTWMPGEFKNYYLYDSEDNRIGFIQLHENMASPFRFINLKSIDTENNKVRTVSLQESWQVNSNFIMTETDFKVDKQKSSDTVMINLYHKKVYTDGDSINYLELYLNENYLIDSTVYHWTCSDSKGKHDCETLINYEYYSNGFLKNKKEQIFILEQGRKLFSQHEYFYFQTGLLDMMTTYSVVNEKRGISKFKYYYRK